MSLHPRCAFFSILLVILPIVVGGCAGASDGAGSAAAPSGGGSAVRSSAGDGPTLEEEVNLALTRFLGNLVESAQGRDLEGEKIAAAWGFLPTSRQNKLNEDGAGPSPGKILRFLDLSGAPDPDFEIEIIEADFLLKTGSARITLSFSGDSVTRIVELERVSCEGIGGTAELNPRIEECQRTNAEPWKITSVAAPE